VPWQEGRSCDGASSSRFSAAQRLGRWRRARNSQQCRLSASSTRVYRDRRRRAFPHFAGGWLIAGFIENKNVTIEFRWANLRFGQLPSLVPDLVNRQVAIIFEASYRGPLRAAQPATARIPIVFYYGGDPVKDGFVASLSRPGGNMTGLTGVNSELAPKRVGLLHEMVPQATTIGFLTGRPNGTADIVVETFGRWPLILLDFFRKLVK
jgi:hypothetical protein